MHLLQSGVPFNVIALWLGHESMNTTHRYVEANLAMKEKALARLEAKAGNKQKALDTIAVGDGANDLGMLGVAGTGVALHAKPSVAVQCAVRVNHGDLTALLYLQGYFRPEFAE